MPLEALEANVPEQCQHEVWAVKQIWCTGQKNFPGQDVLEDLKRERHLTALWETWIPAQKKKIRSSSLGPILACFFRFFLSIFTILSAQMHAGISTYLSVWIRRSDVSILYLLVWKKTPKAPLPLTRGWGIVSTVPPPPLHTRAGGLSPPLSGAQHANLSSVSHSASWRGGGRERGKGTRAVRWGREDRGTGLLWAHTLKHALIRKS